MEEIKGIEDDYSDINIWGTPPQRGVLVEIGMEQHRLIAIGFLVKCEGCGAVYLGGTDSPSDPVNDATYRSESKTFVCNTCYQDKSWFRKSVVEYINAQFDYPMSVN